ncbi:hypothetical protein HG531_003098 [Fusarium graminearum]|nr:hypothetical protein HG531_003098 [Fusarium graminearum]
MACDEEPRHIEANHGLGVVKQEFCQSLGEKGLSGTRRTTKQEARWLIWVAQAGTLESDSISDRPNSLLLTNNDLAENLFHVDELLLLGSTQTSNRDASPSGHNLVDVICGDNVGDHGTAGIVISSGIEGGICSSLASLEFLDDTLLFGNGTILEIGSLGVLRIVHCILKSLLKIIKL